jgi:hypothetical protein
MGSPKELTTTQVAHLNELTRDLPEIDKAVRSGSDGAMEFSIPMNDNDIVLVELLRNHRIRSPRTAIFRNDVKFSRRHDRDRAAQSVLCKIMHGCAALQSYSSS